MNFFVTSTGLGKGADLGGLAGADKHCQDLAKAAGAGNKQWRAYLSTVQSGGKAAVNARDRIGKGPWYNAKGERIASNLDDLHSDQAKLTKQTTLTEKGQVVKAEFEITVPAGMTALVFNTRRDVFKDQRVRQALMTLFDAEWINRTLYNGRYTRTQSFFERSYLSSAGKPADDTERALLANFPGAVKPDILEGKFRFPVSDGSGQNRANQKAAFALLHDAGYELRNGRLTNAATGAPLSFEVLANNNAQEALLLSFARNLEPLGIAVRVRVVDSAQYQERVSGYDYDMIQASWASSLSPGNEQLFRWSAATANSKGSFNFAGVANPAADAMIRAMLAAKTESEFKSAVRALDRVLLTGDYVIPLFFAERQWVAHWARLKHPDKTPLFGYAIDTWWSEPAK